MFVAPTQSRAKVNTIMFFFFAGLSDTRKTIFSKTISFGKKSSSWYQKDQLNNFSGGNPTIFYLKTVLRQIGESFQWRLPGQVGVAV